MAWTAAGLEGSNDAICTASGEPPPEGVTVRSAAAIVAGGTGLASVWRTVAVVFWAPAAVTSEAETAAAGAVVSAAGAGPGVGLGVAAGLRPLLSNTRRSRDSIKRHDASWRIPSVPTRRQPTPRPRLWWPASEEPTARRD